jgi:hypothetical protein
VESYKRLQHFTPILITVPVHILLQIFEYFADHQYVLEEVVIRGRCATEARNVFLNTANRTKLATLGYPFDKLGGAFAARFGTLIWFSIAISLGQKLESFTTLQASTDPFKDQLEIIEPPPDCDV